MLRFVFGMIAVVVLPTLLEAASLKPASVEQAFITPGVKTSLRWRVESGPLADPVEYRLHDYRGQQTGSGKAQQSGSQDVEVRVELAQGFYEIEFPATKQRFGIVALPAAEKPRDPFFAIDGALSWLVSDDATREGLIKAAARMGIDTIRERLTWGAVHPALDRWQWEGGVRFDTLRGVYARHGVKVLEMAHDGPHWMGRVGKYPENLVETMQSWREIARHWGKTWSALEVWNEPDIFFGDNLPADQYVAIAKAVSYGAHEAGIKVPVVGGVMAHCNQEFLNACTGSRLLEHIDAFSFHTYDRAPQMESLVRRYRIWLDANRKGSMPLWISECGQPWKVGPDRPPVDQDATSALDIVMKAIEARACGIERHFPFVYPYYVENANNFGMMDKQSTPLRAIGAYAQMIRVLSGSRYVGDVKNKDGQLQRARLFDVSRRNAGGTGEAEPSVIAVLYTGQTTPVRVRTKLPIRRSEGIDGRSAPVDAEGALTIPDGLAYVWLDRAKTDDYCDPTTVAAKLYAKSQAPPPERSPGRFPLVLRYQFDPKHVVPSSEGYRLKNPQARSLPFGVRIYNLSGVASDLDVLVGPSRATGSAGRSVTAPAHGSVDVAWELDLTGCFSSSSEHRLLVTAHVGDKVQDQLAVTLFGEGSLVETLQRHKRWVGLPIRNAALWTPSIAGHGEMKIEVSPEGVWKFQAKFKEKDRWVYPVFKLPENVKLSEKGGLVLRARCQKPAAVRVFLWEGDSGVGYLSPKPLIPADGQWHVVKVNFQDLVLSNANAPDPDGRLNLEQVRRISIGINSDEAENSLEVSDACVVDQPN